MEFEGIVLQVLPEVRIQTQRGEFVKQEVIFEQPSDYSRKVCVTFTGERIAAAAQLTPNEKVKISFNIESREWNGKWFTEVRGWKIEKPSQGYAPVPPQGGYVASPQPQQPAANVQGYPTYANQPVQQPQPATQSAPLSNPEEADDLPF